MPATTELNKKPMVVFSKKMGEKIYEYAHQELLLNKCPSRVLRFVVEGWTNKEIADHLRVKEKTVKYHITHIFHSLGVKNRQSLILKLPIFKNDLNRFDSPPNRRPL